MTKKFKPGMNEYITLAFYAGFILLPFIFNEGISIQEGFRHVFVVFPANLVLYVIPALMWFFVKKQNFTPAEGTAVLLATDAVTLVTIYTSLHDNTNSFFFSYCAMLVLSVICMNTKNTVVQALILLPGLLTIKTGTPYLFATYIPVLMLLIIQHCGKKTDNAEESKEKKQIPFVLTAYLYIIVAVAIFMIAGKLELTALPASNYFYNLTYIFSFAAGCTLIIAAAVLFIIRAMPVIKNGKIAEKVCIVIFAVYPVILTAVSFFINIVSNDVKKIMLLSLFIYIMGNIQLQLTHGENIPPILPEKCNKSLWAVVAVVIFCAFCFD